MSAPESVKSLAGRIGVPVVMVSRLVSDLCESTGADRVVAVAAESMRGTVLTGFAVDQIERTVDAMQVAS